MWGFAVKFIDVSRIILAGEFKEGDTVLVDYAEGEYKFERKAVTAEAS